MRNIFTITPKDLEELSDHKLEKEELKLEPNKDVVTFISQFAKVYYVEKQIRRFGLPGSLILN